LCGARGDPITGRPVPEEYPCGVLEFLEHGGGLRPPNLDGDGDLEPVAAFFSGSCQPS
jgi:hypothetical protein